MKKEEAISELVYYYKVISNPSVEEAEITVSKAKRFVSAIKEYLSPPKK